MWILLIVDGYKCCMRHLLADKSTNVGSKSVY